MWPFDRDNMAKAAGRQVQLGLSCCGLPTVGRSGRGGSSRCELAQPCLAIYSSTRC